MYLITLVLTWLVIQVWGGVSVIQRDDLQHRWFQLFFKYIPNGLPSTVSNVLALLLPVLLLVFILSLLGDSLASIPMFFLTLTVLLFALGRGDVMSRLHAFCFSINDEETSVIVAAKRYYGLEAEPDHLAIKIYQRVAYQLYERWFAVVLWFLIVGAPGALFYRICQCASDAKTTDASPSMLEAITVSESQDQQTFYLSLREDAGLIMAIMDWLPARLWVLILGVASYFGTSLELLSARFFDRISARKLFTEFFLAELTAAQRAGDAVDLSVGRVIQKKVKAIEQISQRAMLCALIFFLAILLLTS